LVKATFSSESTVIFTIPFAAGAHAVTSLVGSVLSDGVRQGWRMTKRGRVSLGALVIGVVLVAVAAGVVAGRVTAPAHDPGFAQGNAAGYAEGVAAGRSLQIGDSVPAGSKEAAQAAFQAGYRAGETDAFGAYDGGWKLGTPYVVILDKGVSGATYRFVERDQLTPGTTYHLCPDGTTLCQS
jgi:hypothetical protein